MNIKSSSIEPPLNNHFYRLKAFAIIFVVAAHTATLSNSTNGVNNYISLFLHSIGSFGVPIFFILSGYFFYLNKKSFFAFFQSKLTSVFLPWVFSESIVWLYVVIRKGGFNFFSWFSFIIGFNHSTYYLTVLIIFYLFFYYILIIFFLI
jgi:surface polysaccharide O-acyltransferase-like enzyme